MNGISERCVKPDKYEKLGRLKEMLAKMGKAVVAFSGGVDSTFLLKVAAEVLGDGVIAVTAKSESFAEREFREAVEFAGALHVRHIVVTTDELAINGFRLNPADRCYHCKKETFMKLADIAVQNDAGFVLDGSNADDVNDYRPGMKALKEMGIVSPLRETGLTKEEIRELSREMGLATWDKPSFACLASRFPYGHEITREKLRMVENAEQLLLDLGFRQVRVRHHGEIARIEVAREERGKFFDAGLMDRVHEKMKELGFKYVTLDLRGYRTGSLNEGVMRDK